jgi:hypothetical protein
MVFGIGKNGGTFGDEEPDDLDSNEELIPAAPAGSFKKGGHVKKTGLAKVHKGETVIPALKSMRIQLHRDSDGKLTGFTVHHEHLPKPSKSPAFMETTTEAHPFGVEQHEDMLDHVHRHTAGQS